MGCYGRRSRLWIAGQGRDVWECECGCSKSDMRLGLVGLYFYGDRACWPDVDNDSCVVAERVLFVERIDALALCRVVCRRRQWQLFLYYTNCQPYLSLSGNPVFHCGRRRRAGFLAAKEPGVTRPASKQPPLSRPLTALVLASLQHWELYLAAIYGKWRDFAMVLQQMRLPVTPGNTTNCIDRMLQGVRNCQGCKQAEAQRPNPPDKDQFLASRDPPYQ